MIQVTGSTTVALQTRGTSSSSACFSSKPRPPPDRDPLNYRTSRIENVRRFQNAIWNFSKETEAINLLSIKKKKQGIRTHRFATIWQSSNLHGRSCNCKAGPVWLIQDRLFEADGTWPSDCSSKGSCNFSISRHYDSRSF